MKNTKKELLNKIIIASNVIHKQSLHGSGNYMIVSSSVADIINNTFDNLKQIELLKKRKKKILKILKNIHENSINNRR